MELYNLFFQSIFSLNMQGSLEFSTIDPYSYLSDPNAESDFWIDGDNLVPSDKLIYEWIVVFDQ